MLSLDDLQVFIEVYKCRNYTHAAAKLKLSQPTVSRKIKAMLQKLIVDAGMRYSVQNYPTRTPDKSSIKYTSFMFLSISQ